MMAFLQHYVFKRAAEKDVLVCGVIERSFGRSITKHVVKRMLEHEPEVFSACWSRCRLTPEGSGVQADAILDATRYNDAVLLSLALDRGEQLDWYAVEPTLKIQRRADCALPGGPDDVRAHDRREVPDAHRGAGVIRRVRARLRS